MSKTVKNSLICAAVLVAIAVVSVTCLMLANAFLPKYKPTLNLEKIGQLHQIAQSGAENDQAALDGEYFKILGEEDFDLEKFNSDNRATGQVLAVYMLQKGDGAGTYITETQTTGYGSQIMVLLTSYNKDGTIAGLIKLRDDGDYLLVNDAEYEALRNAVIGKKVMTSAEIKAATGATESASPNGIEKNLRLSGELIAALNKEGA